MSDLVIPPSDATTELTADQQIRIVALKQAINLAASGHYPGYQGVANWSLITATRFARWIKDGMNVDDEGRQIG